MNRKVLQLFVSPCEKYQRYLAARHPKDLLPSERAALEDHITSCSICAQLAVDYDVLTNRIRALPKPKGDALPQFLSYAPWIENAATHSHFSNFNVPVKDTQETAPIRGTRLHRLANMVAAILIIAILAGGSFLLFRNHHVLPGSRTSSAPVCDFRNLHGTSWASICDHHLYQDVNVVRSIGGHNLTIEQVYADQDQVVLAYTVTDLNNKSDKLATLVATTTIEHTIVDQNSGYNGGGWYDAQRGLQVNFRSFHLADFQIQAKILHIHLAVERVFINPLTRINMDQPVATTQLQNADGPVLFDFTTSFYPSRLVTINQTVTVNAKSVTLERVSITPSTTRVFLSTPLASSSVSSQETHAGPSGNGATYDTFTLVVAGKSFVADEGGNKAQRDANGTLYSQSEIDYYAPFSTEHGQWTLTVANTKENGAPWIFHFQMP